MKKTSFESMNCSLARTLEIVGEWWTLLIIREAMWGTSRFDDFHHRLGIARNILTARLVRLEEFGVIERLPSTESARIYDYKLTEKGWDLFAVVVALMQWGDRWIYAKEGPPIQFFDRLHGARIQPIVIRNTKGKLLRPEQIDIRPGPGAHKSTIRRTKLVSR